ncbi:MAG: hypothetical protein MJZ31_11365 [Bacteroidales bacterium]|nr:hypothetical protein [Bacteroidales bacterium]
MKRNYAVLFLSVMSLIFTSQAFSQERTIEIVKDGAVVFSTPAADIDYLTVVNRLSAPKNVHGAINDGAITVTWNAVADATTYNIFRSNDGITFTKIGSSNTTSYTDNAPATGNNFYQVQAIGDDHSESAKSTASSPILNNEDDAASGIYLGIIGFNQKTFSHPISYLTESTKETYDNFVDGLTTKNGTLLYYSVDQALNDLESRTFPSNLFNVTVVTFTDGLDQGSMMLGDDYDTDEEYLEALNKRIKNETVAGLPITSYAIGIRGSDVTDVAKFTENLQKLASSNENAMEVSSMSQVNEKFQEIASQLTTTSFVQSISITMPGQSTGTRVRFTLDNVTAAGNSQLYIEGTFNKKDKSLSELTYNGMRCTSGDVLYGEQDGIFVTFTFEGVQADSKVLIPRDYMQMWTYIASTEQWQVNSEFDKEGESELQTEKRSAAIMLVLDCSSSLGEQFANVQSNAKGFINTLCTSSDDDGSSEGDTTLPSDNLSTMPMDLSLAVVRDGVRYYMTKEEYDKYGTSQYLVEGVCVIGGGESFIVALDDYRKDYPRFLMSHDYAKKYYPNLLPNTDEANVIISKWWGINDAISDFGGEKIANSYYNDSDNNSYIVDGGVESSYWGWQWYVIKSYNLNYNDYGIVRCVISTNDPVSEYTNDMKLKVNKDGHTMYLSVSEYERNGVPFGYTIVGLNVVAPTGEEFAIELNNRSKGAVSYDNALILGEKHIPTYDEYEIIVYREEFINKYLKAFGGAELPSYFWTTDGGDDARYVRGVVR